MKTLKALIVEATTLSDEEFDNEQWVAWFNDALNDLTEVLFISKQITLPKDEKGTFTLPEDLKSILRVDTEQYTNLKNIPISDDVAKGYRIIGDTIVLRNVTAEELTLLYYRFPKLMSTSDSEVPIDISSRFSKALVLYACAQGMLKEDETERYTLFWNEYQMFKAEIQSLMKSQMPGRAGIIGVVR